MSAVGVDLLANLWLKGIHDWDKFIEPRELSTIMQKEGLGDIEIKGFDFFGQSLPESLDILLHHLKTEEVKININEDTSVMYIGKAKKY